MTFKYGCMLNFYYVKTNSVLGWWCGMVVANAEMHRECMPIKYDSPELSDAVSSRSMAATSPKSVRQYEWSGCPNCEKYA